MPNPSDIDLKPYCADGDADFAQCVANALCMHSPKTVVDVNVMHAAVSIAASQMIPMGGRVYALSLAAEDIERSVNDLLLDCRIEVCAWNDPNSLLWLIRRSYPEAAHISADDDLFMVLKRVWGGRPKVLVITNFTADQRPMLDEFIEERKGFYKLSPQKKHGDKMIVLEEVQPKAPKAEKGVAKKLAAQKANNEARKAAKEPKK